MVTKTRGQGLDPTIGSDHGSLACLNGWICGYCDVLGSIRDDKSHGKMWRGVVCQEINADSLQECFVELKVLLLSRSFCFKIQVKFTLSE